MVFRPLPPSDEQQQGHFDAPPGPPGQPKHHHPVRSLAARVGDDSPPPPRGVTRRHVDYSWRREDLAYSRPGRLEDVWMGQQRSEVDRYLRRSASSSTGCRASTEASSKPLWRPTGPPMQAARAASAMVRLPVRHLERPPLGDGSFGPALVMPSTRQPLASHRQVEWWPRMTRHHR